MSFVRASDEQCDLDNYSVCASGQLDLATASAAFPARTDHQVLSFDNKLWLFGGGDCTTSTDIWSSVDGIDWRRGLGEPAGGDDPCVQCLSGSPTVLSVYEFRVRLVVNVCAVV